jgi:hypothetical protein
MIEDKYMNSTIIDKAIKSLQYKYLLLRKDFKGLDQAIEKEEDKTTKYHLMLEKSIAQQKYDTCFEILKKANNESKLLEKDIELYIKGILAKYEKDKDYKKVIVLALDILTWSCVDKRLKGMVYHLLGNSYYFSNKEEELVELVEFLKVHKDYKNHPLVKWANTPVKEEKKK